MILLKFRVIFLGACGFSQAVFKITLHSATLDHAAMLKNSLSLIEICQVYALKKKKKTSYEILPYLRRISEVSEMDILFLPLQSQSVSFNLGVSTHS